jgi:hypothetical protein
MKPVVRVSEQFLHAKGSKIGSWRAFQVGELTL